MTKTRSYRDVFVALLLFLATGSFVLWQNSQVAILWDLGYLLDTSYRIALGQTPYRDFPLVHPPLTFVIQALLIRIAGRVYLVPVLYAAIVGGFATVVAWRIILHSLLGRIVSAYLASLFLTLPLVFLGIYGVYPHPIYDCDCAFAILVAVFLVQRLEPHRIGRTSLYRPLLTGGAVVVPVFFKQNIGLPFLLTVMFGIFLLFLRNLLLPGRIRTPHAVSENSILLRVLAGIAVSGLLAVGVLEVWAGMENYLHWTVHFAAERRLPGLANMLEVYRQPSFLWTLPTLGTGLFMLHSPYCSRLWSRLLALLLCATPFLGSLIFLLIDDDLDERADNLLALWPMLLLTAAIFALFALRRGLSLTRLLPFFVLAAVHGTFLSQQLWGSTYPIWALLLILVAQILADLPMTLRQIPLSLAAIISLTFLVCGSLYAASHERLNYAQLNADDPATPLVQAKLPALRGMANRGTFLPDFEQLLQFASHEIPEQEGILLLPGEEPFYYASGRTSQFPVLLFDHTTDPYSVAELFQEVHRRSIHWIIVKRRLQLDEDPLPEKAQVYAQIAHQFTLYRKLDGYDVYRPR